MLKIKDDVDLKDLEKFGFEKEEYVGVNGTVIRCYFYEELAIYSDTRKIACFNLKRLAFDKLFDLIQAGLVEKVEK